MTSVEESKIAAAMLLGMIIATPIMAMRERDAQLLELT
jgi:hypothetical protein